MLYVMRVISSPEDHRNAYFLVDPNAPQPFFLVASYPVTSRHFFGAYKVQNVPLSLLRTLMLVAGAHSASGHRVPSAATVVRRRGHNVAPPSPHVCCPCLVLVSAHVASCVAAGVALATMLCA